MTDAAPPSQPQRALAVLPVAGLGEIRRGDDLATLIAGVVDLLDGDVVVVTQKIVSKAEGRMVRVDPDDPDDRMRIIESESVRVLRRRGDRAGTVAHDRLATDRYVGARIGGETVRPRRPRCGADRRRPALSGIGSARGSCG